MHIQAALELINSIHFLRSCGYIEAKCVMCMFFNCTYTATYLLLMYAHNLSSQSTYCMKINISQRSCFPTKNAREAIVLLNGYQADSIKTNPAIVVETFCISFWCICCFSYKIQMKREWEESSLHTVFCCTLSLIFSTKSLFGIGLENISILMLSVCKHEQYALMVTKSFGTTSMLYAHILRIHIF